ncbi:xanthine dehydrogenase small subunit [Candidatus Pelagibacter sp.]|nr:xanthine dehydrogenase small subunit [Candidatus Pelagibacter sp.]
MVSNSIRFIFEDKIKEIKNPDSNETILNFIRLRLKKTGTKEGCAEGGCGACTVVLGEFKKNKIIYKAINSCIAFTTSLEGKQLLIVEDLIEKDGSLHPVQSAMINFHGSQCGFCTPGFIMSLFSMYKNKNSYDKKTIEESISGNLCRCTGYRPIIDAAKSLKNSNPDQFKKNEKKTISLLKKIRPKNISINNKSKKYFAPRTINELKKIIKKNKNAEFISGGTDMSLVVTKQKKDIKNIIYLNSIDELNYIKEKDKYIEVGATTPLIKFELIIKKYYPDFNRILKRYGSVQIRNVATLAGNMATASPIGDSLPLLLSLDASITIESFNKKMVVPLKDFFISYRKTKLKKGQFIRSIRIPIFKKNIFKAYKISKRIDDDISSVCASFNLAIINKKIKNIKIAYGGMAATPKRAVYCEKILLNSNFSEDIILKAQKSLEKDFQPIDDMRASKDYRIAIAKNLLIKCFAEIKKNKLIRLNH